MRRASSINRLSGVATQASATVGSLMIVSGCVHHVESHSSQVGVRSDDRDEYHVASAHDADMTLLGLEAHEGGSAKPSGVRRAGHLRIKIGGERSRMLPGVSGSRCSTQ